jgi:hypothetical protein
VERVGKGEFELHLAPEERDLLRGLPAQLKELLGSDDPSLRRLFPPAYTDDPALEAEYRHYMADDLMTSHERALDVMEVTVDADVLNEDELQAWLRALNDLRLVLGTRLDVSEDLDPSLIDPDDPRAPVYFVYDYLSGLQSDVIDALSG